MPRLEGKVALITGAGTGIGRATAILFAREGARVAIAEINAAAGEESAHLAGNGAIAIPTDVTDPDNLERAIKTATDHFGGLHVLHNNAGGSTAVDDTAVEAPLDEFLFLRFRARNEPPFVFEWVDERQTEFDYGAVLTRILRKYEARFR